MNTTYTAYETDEEIFGTPTYGYTPVRELQADATETVEIDYFRKARKAGFFKQTVTVETVTVEELENGDDVVVAGSEFTVLGKVSSVFQTRYATPAGEPMLGAFRLVVGGTPRMVAPGTTFQRRIR